MNGLNNESTSKPKLKLSLDAFRLSQPELLQEEELASVLIERGVVPSLLPQGKEKLVALFKKVAYPYPQRELKNNYRGSLLKKLREKRANHIKFNEPSNDNQSSFTIGDVGNSTNSKNSSRVKQCTERLKPPPDLINFERKTIKLNSPKSEKESIEHTRPDLENIVIKKRKTSETSSDLSVDKSITLTLNKTSLKEPIEKSELQNIDKNTKNGSCSTQEYNSLTGKPATKKVSLKRNHLFSKAPSLPTEDAIDKSASEPDKKRKPITWP